MEQRPLFANLPIIPATEGIAYYHKHAVFSSCGAYRWVLLRRWDSAIGRLPRVLWIALNPSTASGEEDDPTLRQIVSFSKREGFGSLMLCNLFAFCSTDPKALNEDAIDCIGDLCDAYLYSSAALCDAVIVAWGTNVEGYEERAKAIVSRLSKTQKVYCLGKTKDGFPKHPLYLPKDAPLRIFARPKAKCLSATVESVGRKYIQKISRRIRYSIRK